VGERCGVLCGRIDGQGDWVGRVRMVGWRASRLTIEGVCGRKKVLFASMDWEWTEHLQQVNDSPAQTRDSAHPTRDRARRASPETSCSSQRAISSIDP
jgi:hypothetical protein